MKAERTFEELQRGNLLIEYDIHSDSVKTYPVELVENNLRTKAICEVVCTLPTKNGKVIAVKKHSSCSKNLAYADEQYLYFSSQTTFRAYLNEKIDRLNLVMDMFTPMPKLIFRKVS